MQTLKLGSMRPTFVDTSKELPPLDKVGCASNFGKVVIQADLRVFASKRSPKAA
ncbi:hypothetical protein J1N35_034863 [Gossypium stocksii]|uniref:Uncharacterized protein n=1 Tax=Gossypium stocksii TaxID=47602 RepID=A0A9D3ZQJ0_9ROSI|nr:hypothetical protein J1N35_034863 [Gossypium stocksii]